MNEKYLKEAKEIEARWAKTGLLDGLTSAALRTSTGVLLESQRLINEQSTAALDVAHGVLCIKCGGVLEYWPVYDEECGPKRMVCKGCKHHYQAGWDEAEDIVRYELTH